MGKDLWGLADPEIFAYCALRPDIPFLSVERGPHRQGMPQNSIVGAGKGGRDLKFSTKCGKALHCSAVCLAG